MQVDSSSTFYQPRSEIHREGRQRWGLRDGFASSLETIWFRNQFPICKKWPLTKNKQTVVSGWCPHYIQRRHQFEITDQDITRVTYRKYKRLKDSGTTQEKSTYSFCSKLIYKHPSGYPENCLGDGMDFIARNCKGKRRIVKCLVPGQWATTSVRLKDSLQHRTLPEASCASPPLQRYYRTSCALRRQYEYGRTQSSPGQICSARMCPCRTRSKNVMIGHARLKSHPIQCHVKSTDAQTRITLSSVYITYD